MQIAQRVCFKITSFCTCSDLFSVCLSLAAYHTGVIIAIQCYTHTQIHTGLTRTFDANRLMPEVKVSFCGTVGAQQLINISPALSVFSAPRCAGSSLALGRFVAVGASHAPLFLAIYMPVSMNSNEHRCCCAVC